VNGVNVTRTITAGQAIDFGGTGGGNVTVGESRPATSTEQNSGQVFQITAVNTVVDLQQRGLVQGSTRSEFTIGSGTIRVNTGNPTSLTQNSPQ
jgi:hypothetical protein